MKNFFLGLIALLPAVAFAQNSQPFTVKGKVGNINAPAMAYLAYRLGANTVTDSVVLKNGEFVFTGEVMNPVNATLMLDYKGLGFQKYVQQNFPQGGMPIAGADYLPFYVEKGIINLVATDSLKNAKITGSKLNDDDARLKTQLKPIIAEAQTISKEAQKATAAQQQSAAFQNSMQSRFKALQDKQKTALRSFITANPDSYLSLLALTSVSGPSPDVNEVEPLFNGLSDELKNSDQGKQLKYSLDKLRITAIGSMAPDFTQEDVNGKPVSLSSFKGKYVLIDFWASWCGPCRQENPNVVRTYNKYRGKNFTVLGVSLDRENGKAAWLAAIKSDGLNWTQVSDLKFWDNLVAKLYGVESIPQNFLIDPQGKIIAKNLRGDDLDAKLEQLFGKI
ncbi:AhpC/TSA family protein [Mucilaginibacter terrenus]|uniref:AhpC/TSA family protein n=1 Tax=Mucilaginibacter terrenus TaxID=2482727 RepID=A0A3E2NQE5_9SPHI|nr:TlpA disulfide reductase family protein [Mucilaginibacter terrenus]RFZ83217.1 AhpC/TSA family protein [Mucilaginibacter terrenus]